VSAGLELEARERPLSVPRAGVHAAATRALAWLNRRIVEVAVVALLAAAGVLTVSVVTRYLFKVPTDWQDEAAVFLMVGATFMSGASVQAQRGHVGIAALAGILPPRINRWRAIASDLVSLLFCAFFSWKSWVLLREAVVDGQTSSSTWAPPLWIPYSLMAAGMTLVAVQLLLQLLQPFLSEQEVRA
jgi:TRAP-type C4-dicarboxylate transport system permease small subunit